MRVGAGTPRLTAHPTPGWGIRKEEEGMEARLRGRKGGLQTLGAKARLEAGVRPELTPTMGGLALEAAACEALPMARRLALARATRGPAGRAKPRESRPGAGRRLQSTRRLFP